MTSRYREILEELLKIYSPSKKEIKLAIYAETFMKNLGCQVYKDENQAKYGGDAPVIFCHLPGNIEGDGVTFSSHMDVVEPNYDLKLIKEKDIWRSDGQTTLGGDDKAGLAIILYLFEYFKEKEHPDLFAVFTPAEEIGMLGARNINWHLVDENIKLAKNMIVLDNAGPVNEIAYQAPMSYHFKVIIKGKTAHAGIEPEKGISAIKVMAEVVSKMKLGRIDSYTTANIGSIRSDYPTNVVADECVIIGEVRGHDEDRVKRLLSSYDDILKESGCEYLFDVDLEYPSLKSLDNLEFGKNFSSAIKKHGLEPEFKIIGGGSDANFFQTHGFNSIILGVGMKDVHTKTEYLDLKEAEKMIDILITYIGE